MSDLLRKIEACPPISNWLETDDQRLCTELFKLATLSHEPMYVSWETAGIEESEWARLPQAISRLLVPPQVTLQGRIWDSTFLRDRMDCVTLSFSNIEDWFDISGGRHFRERLALGEKFGLGIQPREHQILHSDRFGNCGLDLLLEPINPKLVEKLQ